MLRTNFESARPSDASRPDTRRRPLPALAILACASACALPLTAALAQKSVKTDILHAATPAAGAVRNPGAVATPITTPITPVTPPAVIPFNVSTYRYDNGRSGVNPLETVLTPSAIKATLDPKTGLPTAIPFGKLFTRQLDGPSYGQPLYYSNLTLTNAFTGATSTHNVVFVTTNNNTIYAFDADSSTGANSGALWSANFNSIPNGIGPTSGNDITDIFGLPQADIQPLIGIVGTPVIDPVAKVLYVVVRTTEGAGYAHRLHAIDITTGLEKSYGPQLIGQQVDVFGDVSPVIVPGQGDDPYDANNIFFDTATELQRPALTLANGMVFVAYGGFQNSPPYHGWMFAFNAATLNPQAVFCTTPNEFNSFVPGDPLTTGGIDMSGVGPAADASGLYFSTGLGNANRNTAGASYGESVLKLRLGPTTPAPAFPYQTVPVALPTLAVLGVFTPYNFDFLTANQLDLGVGGVALLPLSLITGHPHTMVVAGTEGKIYLLDVDGINAMSNFADTPATGALNTFPGALLGPTFGVPAVYTSVDTSGVSTTTVYYHAGGDVLRPFTVSAAFPYLTPNALTGSAQYGFPGAMPQISGNGTNSSTAILWELEARQTPPLGGGGGISNQPPTTVLHAYNVAPIAAVPATATTPAVAAVPALTEIFNSTANGGGATNIGDYVNFTQPLVAGGKVYVAAGTPTQGSGLVAPPTGLLAVFGILPPTTKPVTKALHYMVSGPLQFGATVIANRSNYYNITAVDTNYNPVVINNSDVTLTLTNLITGRKLSMGSVHFNNQSSVIFSRAITPETFGFGFFPNFYNLQGFDSSGNASNVAQLGVIGSIGNGGFDHYNIRVVPATRAGATTTVTVTAVNQSGLNVPYMSTVLIYDTLPNGIAGNAYGPLNVFAYQSAGNPPLVPPGPVIGSATFNIVLNGVGQHIIVVQDQNQTIFTQSTTATTALINVLGTGSGVAGGN